MTDIRVLISYLETLLISFISCSGVFVLFFFLGGCSSAFSIYGTMPSANGHSFTPSFLIWVPFVPFLA